jgi:hypothetical protein
MGSHIGIDTLAHNGVPLFRHGVTGTALLATWLSNARRFLLTAEYLAPIRESRLLAHVD